LSVAFEQVVQQT